VISVKLLIAEDDTFFRRLLEQTLVPQYEVISAHDGVEAWTVLRQPDAPQLAILDWIMPGLSGPQVCQNLRQSPAASSTYLIILTAKNSPADVAAGLRLGADDYVTKPFTPEVLRARVRTGERVVNLYNELHARDLLLQQVEAREKRLRLLMPFCPGCGQLRLDDAYWRHVEDYIHHLPAAPIGTCPSCSGRIVLPQFQLAASSSGNL
jgi:phosphoserine phosphatase RsbU/P